jgi:hypothetical protein
MKHNIIQCLRDNIIAAIDEYLRFACATSFILHDNGRVLVFGDKKEVTEYVEGLKP